MPTAKYPVHIWPFEKAKTLKGETVAVFDLPDGSDLYIRYDTPEELRAAQFKAMATARAIVRTQNPQAFAGLKA